MNDSWSPVPAPRDPADTTPGPLRGPVPLAELLTWHEPGIHRVRLADREVWVRMDGRGIASVSSLGPERLAAHPLA